MNRGKDICKQLKAIRKSIAMNYNLDYTPRECTYEGDCLGTCPLCDAEIQDLQRQIDERGIKDVDLNVEIDCSQTRQSNKIESEDDNSANENKCVSHLMGDVSCSIDGAESPEPEILMGMPTYIPPVQPRKQKKRALYMECPIAGTMFHDLEDVWDELEEGTQLALVRHKHNPHDKNAVAVCLANDFDGDIKSFDFDFILGYVPKDKNEMIAKFLDLGWDEIFSCVLSEKNGTASHGKLIMRIYLESKYEVDASEVLTKVVELSDEECLNFYQDINELGYCYFRWGGFPLVLENLDFVKKNDKIVFLHRTETFEELYLMHCIAKGDDASHFIREEDNGQLDFCDDCCFYALSISKGPIKVAKGELEFLEDEEINFSTPLSYLSLDASERIMEIINK